MAQSEPLNQKTLLAAIERQLREHPLLKSFDPEFVRKYRARYSEVFEFRHRSQGEAAPILVKCRTGYGSDEQAQEMAAREFTNLKELKERSSFALEGTVPLPLALFPKLSAIVLSKLPGEDLRRILQRKMNLLSGRFWQEELSRIALLIGQWLKHFHESTRRPPTQFDDRAFLAEVKAWLEQCSSGGLDSATADGILELISKASQRASGQLALRAAKHGDFIPVNILVAGEHIAVLDFEDFNECDVVYEDIGMLCAYFIFMKKSRLYFRRAIDVMIPSFLQGYGDFGSELLRDLYTMKAILNLSACQFQQSRRVPGNRGKLQRYQRNLFGIAQTLLGKAAGLEQQTPAEPARSVSSLRE